MQPPTRQGELATAARDQPAERREFARESICRATAECLVEDGLAALATAAVAGRAGVSEGSIADCFPSKRDLLAGTLEWMLGDLRSTYEERFAEFDAAQIDARGMAELIWELTCDRRLLAVLELTLEARADAALRDLIEPAIANHRATMHARVRMLLHDRPIESWPLLGGAVDTIVLALQGMQLHNVVVRDPDHVRLMHDFIVASMELAFVTFDGDVAARQAVE